MPICNPYRVEARGSAGSDGNHGRVCLGVGEHVPMPISSIGRRGARLQGQCAVCRHDTDQTQSVTRRRRWHLNTSRTAFTTDHESHQEHIGCLADASHHSDCHRRRPAAQRQMDTSGSAGRHRDHNQPLRWCHAPTVGSTGPAGHRAVTMWRPCSAAAHGVWLMTQSSLVCEISIGRGCNFHCYFTV